MSHTPHGLHIQKEGSTEFLYLCDRTRGLVVKATLDGWTVRKYSRSDIPNVEAVPSQNPLQPDQPRHSAQWRHYVADGYGSSYVNQYIRKGECIRTFGGLGSEAGQLN